MYAAYDYDKEQEDELSFRAGDRLLVLERNCCYKAWWLCQTTLENNTEKGLAPSNYLSLYPSVSKRSADFRMFDIPQVPKLRAEKVEGRVNCSTATDEKISAFPVASEDLVS
ncbi:unnamed protein product [Gongylonema pulchrum]|uniref:SH3 domain-containing protein n=1 Tax=Gongylonema pulchrum TaxID=637853 RepID=A0A183DQX6_9BILA|nr:unnamed protein product [Gongylonema pulchrum]